MLVAHFEHYGSESLCSGSSRPHTVNGNGPKVCWVSPCGHVLCDVWRQFVSLAQ